MGILKLLRIFDSIKSKIMKAISLQGKIQLGIILIYVVVLASSIGIAFSQAPKKTNAAGRCSNRKHHAHRARAHERLRQSRPTAQGRTR
jgi:hypothetical protein